MQSCMVELKLICTFTLSLLKIIFNKSHCHTVTTVECSEWWGVSHFCVALGAALGYSSALQGLVVLCAKDTWHQLNLVVMFLDGNIL